MRQAPEVNASTATRYFDTQFETASLEKVKSVRWNRLTAHLTRALETSFYQQKLGVNATDSLGIRTPQDFEKLPLTRKSELVADVQNMPYGGRLRVAAEEIVGMVETSGTSGMGKELHILTARDRERVICIEACGFHWAGVRRGSVVALTLPISMGAAGMWWYLGLDNLGANTLRLGMFSAAEKLDYMMRFQANVLVATPAYIGRLEATAEELGVELSAALPSLEAIIMAGETKSPNWVAERERLWGSVVYEQWGCSAGAVAWCCEGGMRDGDRLRMMHCSPQWTYFEVVDPDTGSHVGNGEFGEIVITPLEVYGAPLVRFATGDRARFMVASNCDCGRPFDGIQAGSVSRFDDMVKVKGVNIWPSAVTFVIDAYPEIEDHLVVIEADERGRETIRALVTFRDTAPNAHRDAIIGRLKDELKLATGLNFFVTATTGQDMGESSLDARSGKVRRWHDLRVS